MKKCTNIVLLTVIAVVLSFSLAGSGCSRSKANEDEATIEEQSEPAEEAVEEDVVEEQPIDYTAEFIARFNTLSDMPLEVVETFNPQDDESPHYRHEFRLSAFADSIGTYCVLNDTKLWIVSGIRGDFRVYLQGPVETLRTAFVISASILNPDTSEEEVEKCINEALDSQYMSESSIVDSPFSAHFFEHAGNPNAGEVVKEDEGKAGYCDVLLEQRERELDNTFAK